MKKVLIYILRGIRILLLTALGTALIAVAIVGYFLYKPEKIFTAANINLAAILAQQSLAKNGTNVTWSNLNLHLHSETFFKKTLTFEADHPCVKQTGLKACFSQISLRAVVEFPRFKISELGPNKILGGEIFYQKMPDLKKSTFITQKEKPKPLRFELPSIIKGAILLPIHVELDQVVYKTDSGSLEGKLNLTSKQESPSSLLFKINAQAKKEKMNGRVDLQGSIGPERIQSKIQLTANHLTPQISKITVENCALDLGFGKSTELRGSSRAPDLAQLNCAIEVNLPPLPSNIPRLDVPNQIALLIKTKTEGEFFPTDLERPIETDSTIELVPFSTSMFEGSGKVSVKYTGKISDIRESKSLRSEMNLSLQVPHFEAMVKQMDRTRWEVPAPFHSMHGTVSLTSQGALKDLRATYPLTFATRLTTQKQKLNLDGNGSLQFDLNQETPTIHAGVDLVFSEVVLILPTLELAKPPQFLADGRIKTAKEIQKANEVLKNPSKLSAFHYDLQINTPPHSPIKILTNLAKAPIPIALNLKMSDTTPIAGSLSVSSFPLELFRREASLDHFTVQLKDPSEESTVDGSFKVVYTDYTIFVTVTSTLGKPRIDLRSSPPLAQDQLIATLLFGHPLDELDPDQSSSVGNTQAAIGDGAVGLASMYALASTPVESVNYDSRSGLLTAKVRLGEGTSLNIGTNQSQLSQVGIRKRLGKHWSIETDVTQGTTNALDPLNADTSTATRGSAMLQWSSRY